MVYLLPKKIVLHPHHPHHITTGFIPVPVHQLVI
ncbi:hypothetical protein BLA29_014017 [Euroglyphus maynei]|uniref:Uncharacterized protein n=1 Tax=Euroglyphus maynei TaxID=6958 RepID=A0A1Y3AVI8_EURMA|nr:hypothetical protein BLA29_014017 [Euroglyphus maynei]